MASTVPSLNSRQLLTPIGGPVRNGVHVPLIDIPGSKRQYQIRNQAKPVWWPLGRTGLSEMNNFLMIFHYKLISMLLTMDTMAI